MSTFIESQQWRYATKKFDKLKKVTDADLEVLQNAIQLSSSSYGLQLYKVIIVNNPEVRAALLPASYGQQQVVDASHLIVFANYSTVDNKDIEDYCANAENIRGLAPGTLKGYENMMISQIGSKSDADIKQWTAKQTYLALGNLLNAAADLKIDACPMEGFDSNQYAEILGIDTSKLQISLVAPIGYRAEDDQTQSQVKVRKSINELFTTIN